MAGRKTKKVMVETGQLSKQYDGSTALDSISFKVKEGELFGFIGPDGAGKTTLFRILTTLVLPDSGYARVNQLDVISDFKKIRHIVGYMPGRFSLYQDLTVEENLNFFASVFGTTVEKNYHLIREIYSRIEPFRKRLAGKLSGGMKQKLALSCALIHAPKLLVLDEPTTGVDAVSRTEFWQVLKNLQKQGITILVSTPYMNEAELCDRVALIQEGRILSVETPKTIINKYDKKLWAVKSDEKYSLIQFLHSMPEMESVFTFGDTVHITTRNNRLNKIQLTTALKKHLGTPVTIEATKPGIEDCFFRLMEKN